MRKKGSQAHKCIAQLLSDVHVLDEVKDAGRVANLVVVPRNELDEVVSESVESMNSCVSWFGDATMTSEDIDAAVKELFEQFDVSKTGSLSYK